MTISNGSSFAAESDVMLRATRRLSLIIATVTTLYGVLAYVVTTAFPTSRLGLLAACTSAITIAWVNRRIIVEAGKYRHLLMDRRLDGSRGVIMTMIGLDATALLVSLCTAGLLLSKLLG